MSGAAANSEILSADSDRTTFDLSQAHDVRRRDNRSDLSVFVIGRVSGQLAKFVEGIRID
jgi:hypothetical protein